MLNGEEVEGRVTRNTEAGTDSFSESDSDISDDTLDISSKQVTLELFDAEKSMQYHLLYTYSVTDGSWWWKGCGCDLGKILVSCV